MSSNMSSQIFARTSSFGASIAERSLGAENDICVFMPAGADALNDIGPLSAVVAMGIDMDEEEDDVRL